MGIITDFFNSLNSSYGDFTGNLSLELNLLVNVFIFSIIIAFYAIFTFKFYKYISKKDLLALNLNQYNTSHHPVVSKIVASFFYLLEYIIILPFLIFFWFTVLTLIIFILSEESASHVIVVGAAIIAAVRILAYYTEDLSSDLAKMVPFTMLTIFILQTGFFDLQRIMTNFTQLNDPSMITTILYFLIFIVGVELILRVIDIIRGFWDSEDERPVGAKANNV